MVDAWFLLVPLVLVWPFFYNYAARIDKQHKMLDSAWMLIANVDHGDWTGQEREWQAAAHWWGVMGGYRATTPSWPLEKRA